MVGENLISPDEVTKLKQYATSVKIAQERAAKAFQIEVQNDMGQKWAVRLGEGDPPTESEMITAKLNNEVTEADISAVRKWKASSKKVFLGDNPKVYAELFEEFAAIRPKVKRSASAQLTEDKKNLTFEQVALFRQRTLESMAEGEISQSIGDRWLRRITPRFNEGADELLKSINEVTVAEGWFFDTTENILKDPNEIADATMRLQDELMKGIDTKEDELDRRLNFDEFKELADDIKTNFTFRTNQNKGTYKLGEIRQISGKLWRVTGYDTDGEPIIDDNLDAPVKEAPTK